MSIKFQVNQKEQVEKMVDDAEAPIKVEIDLKKLTKMFDTAEKAIDIMVQQAEDFKVTSVETRNTAIEMGTQAKQLFNKIEKKRKEIKEPFLKYSQKLDGMVRPHKKKLESIQSGLKKKIKVHIDAENKRKYEQEKKRMELEAMLVPDENQVGHPEKLPTNGKPVIESKHQTESGSASVKKVWKFALEDITKVPAKYLLLNEEAVQTAIDMGVREIAGVKIYEDSDVRLTVARKGGPFNG